MNIMNAKKAIMHGAIGSCYGDADYDADAIIDDVEQTITRLLDCCDVDIDMGCDPCSSSPKIDEYTKALVNYSIIFIAVDNKLSSSCSDYCASDCIRGFLGYKLRLRDDDAANALLHDLRIEIYAHALYPSREFGVLSKAGVPIGRHAKKSA